MRADGVGLMRSEFLYMNADSAPDEDTQFAAYRAVLEKLEGKRVVVRTLDIGADKVPPWLPLPPEENPAMGWRAVRMCLDHRDMFRTQLRALLRASHYGRLAIMFPMIGDLGPAFAGPRPCWRSAAGSWRQSRFPWPGTSRWA